jgi:CheY-like chemotaxis protein
MKNVLALADLRLERLGASHFDVLRQVRPFPLIGGVTASLEASGPVTVAPARSGRLSGNMRWGAAGLGGIAPRWIVPTVTPVDSDANPDPSFVVLLVDDDDGTRGALEELLGNAGYGVRSASNGAAALSLLRAIPPGDAKCDLILLDLMMPIMDGWDFRTKQRADPVLAGIPIILMSAGGGIAVVSEELRAADYINKPVDVPDLLNKVRRICRTDELARAQAARTP